MTIGKLGIVVTKEEVKKAVDEYTETVKDRLVKDRYKFFGMFFGGAKNIPSLKWANGGDIKEVVDAKMLEVLGPKDERDVVVKKVNPTNCYLNTDFFFLPDQDLPLVFFFWHPTLLNTHSLSREQQSNRE